LQNISPYDIFPAKQKPQTLRKLFTGLEELNEMGKISETDIFHSFREYNINMLPWIETLKEGQSAFENTEEDRIPHQIKMGKLYLTKVKMEINMLVGIGTKKVHAYIQETIFCQAKILFIHQKTEFFQLEN
jgi:hypothetical protein